MIISEIWNLLLKIFRPRSKGWSFESHYPVTEYGCGLKAGDYLRLKEDFHVKDANGIPNGKIWKKHEIFGVLTGAKEEVTVVWLVRRNGEQRLTWDDNEEIFDTFEKISADEASIE